MTSPGQTDLPVGDVACKLYMINTGTDMIAHANKLVTPVPKGFEYINLPTFSWLIVNERTNAHVLFDLGCRQDWEKHPPHIVEVIKNGCPGFNVSDSVPSILQRSGISLDDIQAAIISHFHYDHTGDLALFPKTMSPVYGPDFKAQYFPFYPTNPSSPFNEDQFEGREFVELDLARFETSIAGLAAHDYFGDGSLYILHTPGHCKDHLCAFVRTTSGADASFVLLGADSHHFGGQLRPTAAMPLPETLDERQIVNLPRDLPRPCPCQVFTQCHRDQGRAKTTPFFVPAGGKGSFYSDADEALRTLEKLQRLDALPNAFVTMAHDPTLAEVLPTFDSGARGSLTSINDWMAKGWKEAVYWGWLKELPRNGKQGMPPLVDGMYIGGKKVSDASVH